MKTDMQLDRRTFLRRATELGAVAVAAPAMITIAGCSKKSGGDGGGAEKKAGLSCDTDVSAADKAKRDAMEYVEASPHGAKQDCANCQFYTADPAGGCGTCSVVPGTINPKGHCKLWTAKA